MVAGGGGGGASVVVGAGGGGASVVFGAGGGGASVVVGAGGGRTCGVTVDEDCCVAAGVDFFLGAFLVLGFGVYTGAGWVSGGDAGGVEVGPGASPAVTQRVVDAYSYSVTTAVKVSVMSTRLWL